MIRDTHESCAIAVRWKQGAKGSQANEHRNTDDRIEIGEDVTRC
jgi:hypothetical protein